MTDKPRLIDDMKEKLARFQKEYESTNDRDRFMYIDGEMKILRHYIKELEAGTFDPDSPQHPDIQVGERNWQEDMKLCQKATPGPWNIVTDDFGEDDVCYIPTELRAQNGTKVISYEGGFVPIHDVWSAEQLHANAKLISESREALPYWLQQYAALKREYERFQKAAMGWNNDLTKAESLIQQKDAEIARLKKSIEGLRLITKIERSTRVQPEHTSFLRDKGDKL
ncbi:MAG: hypothetical protein ACQEXV_23680 [Bacillota bacterium]